MRKYRERDEKESLRFDSREDSAYTHSRHYHAYYEGYVEKKVWDRGKKRERIERVYVGDYYCRGLDKRGRMKRDAIYFLLFFASLAAFALGGAQRLAVTVKYVYLPAFPALLNYTVLLWALVNYAAAPERMTAWEYKSGSRRVKRFSLAGAVCTAAQAAALAVFIALFPKCGGPIAKAAAVGANIASALCLLLLYSQEKQLRYAEIKNDMKPDRDAGIIQ